MIKKIIAILFLSALPCTLIPNNTRETKKEDIFSRLAADGLNLTQAYITPISGGITLYRANFGPNKEVYIECVERSGRKTCKVYSLAQGTKNTYFAREEIDDAFDLVVEKIQAFMKK